MSLRLIAEKIGYIIAHEEITVAALVKLPIHTYYSNPVVGLGPSLYLGVYQQHKARESTD